ncbi:MAG: glycosyltransferase family 2 protein [Planctomycetota bacterium]
MYASVVVPVRNNRDGLARCVAALRAQSIALEIIVVDDGSSDGGADVARALGAIVLDTDGRGAAAARNCGVRAARGAQVLFTDSDCVPAPNWAARLLGALGAGVIASKGVYASRQGSATAQFVQLEYEERYRRMQRRGGDIDFLDTYSLAVDRAALCAIGGFDERFRGASVEDQEMSFRLLARGRFVFVPDAVVEHQHAATLWHYARKKFHIGRGKAAVLRRHPNRAQGDSHTPSTLRWQVMLTLLVCVATPTSYWWSGTASLACLGVGALAPALLSMPLVIANGRRHGLRGLASALAHSTVRAWALALGLVSGALRPAVRLDGGVQSCLPLVSATEPVSLEPSSPETLAPRALTALREGSPQEARERGVVVAE